MIILTECYVLLELLKIYLKRTKSLRKHRKRLFIPIRGDQDLAKSTLSRWVRYVIKHAYSTISKNPNRLLKPRAHELRALSTSWAYVNYIPLEEILKSAVWSSSSLFASHYLRDFREQTENLRAMGPIIAAQKVVGPRQSGRPRGQVIPGSTLIYEGSSLSEGN